MSSTTVFPSVSTTAIAPTTISAADLTGFSFDITTPGAIDAGGNVTINYQFQNSGLAAGPFTVSFYISSDNVINSADSFLGSFSFTGMDAGVPNPVVSQILTDTFALPGTNDGFWSGDGNYFIGMVVDSGNTVFESNENNNSSVGALIDYDALTVVNTQSANLLGTDFNVVQEPLNAGSSFTVDFSIANGGGGSAAPFEVTFYLSTNDIISTTDVPLGTVAISGLAGNSTGSYTTTLTLPGLSDSVWTGGGTYYIGMIVDSNDDVLESNELDNSNEGLLIDYDDVVINTLILGTNDENNFNGTSGTDLYSGLDDDDLINGNGGNDWLSGDRGDDTIFGGDGVDTLMGRRGDDDLFGGRGDDSLNGGRGDDVLIGVDLSSGNPGEGEVDTLTGGFGADVFVLGDALGTYYTSSSAISYALITDFDLTQDVIQLHGSAADYQVGTPADPTFPAGVGIYRGANELIAIVQGVSTLNFNSSAFEYL